MEPCGGSLPEAAGIERPSSSSLIPHKPIASRAIAMASGISSPSVLICRSGTLTTYPFSAGVRITGKTVFIINKNPLFRMAHSAALFQPPPFDNCLCKQFIQFPMPRYCFTLFSVCVDDVVCTFPHFPPSVSLETFDQIFLLHIPPPHDYIIRIKCARVNPFCCLSKYFFTCMIA